MINQLKKEVHEGQFQYLNRWVDKANFRAFVYNKAGEQTLANSYNEFETLIASGIWFASKPEPSQAKRKHKDVTLHATSE